LSPSPTPSQSAAHATIVPLRPGAMTDAALVLALKERRAGAGQLLFDRYASYVERLVVRVLGIDQEVPDVINDVFVRALERVDQVQDPAALKGWLGSIAIFTTRVLIRDRRSRRRFVIAREVLPEVPVTGTPLEVSRALSRTYELLSSMPVDERIAFALRFIDGMALAELAEVMNVSLGTAKRRLSSAQARFFELAARDPLLREQFSSPVEPASAAELAPEGDEP